MPIRGVRASAYTIPTDAPESDGTLEWDATTLVLVEASAGDATGIGYSYANRATAVLIAALAKLVEGRDALGVAAIWQAMVAAVRNFGRPGIASMAIAAVDNALWDLEYGYDVVYFRRMCQAGAVDVLQADATRCAGITGFMRAAAVAEAFHLPLSSHCAPSIHAHPCCALAAVRHLEYFHDHVRIERMLFDGTLEPEHGALRPARDRPGFGLTFRAADARRYAV